MSTLGSEPSIWTRPARAPRRPALSQEAIVRAAIQVADAGGPDALTMQAVAHALGNFTPMSLYRYVYSKEGLIDLMLDAVLAEARPPVRSTGDWRADVLDLERRTWAAIMRHPWFAQLVHTRPPLGPHALGRTEYLLRTFSDLGADTDASHRNPPSVQAFRVSRSHLAPVHVVWDRRDPFDGECQAPVAVTVDWPEGGARAVDVFGKPQAVEVVAGEMHVSVTDTPIFIDRG